MDQVTEEGSRYYQIIAVLFAFLSVFNSGCHFGWSIASLPKLLHPDYPIDITSEEASYITTISSLGMIFGSLISSLIIDQIGRKKTILLIAIPEILSMIFIYFGEEFKASFYIGRFIGGAAEGAVFTSVPLYFGEIAEPNIRGILGANFSMILVGGFIFSNIIGYYFTIKLAALIYIIPALIFFLIFFNMPETPYWYLMKKRENDAKKILEKLYGKENIINELEGLKNDIKRQLSERGGYRELFTIKANRVGVLSMFGLRFFQQFSGISAITYYSQLFFTEATDSIQEPWASVIFFTIQLISTFISSFFVDKYGRKPLLLLSTLGIFLTLTSLAIYFILRDFYYPQIDNYSFIPLIIMIIYIISYSIGSGSVVNLMLGEVFSASIKAKASSFMIILFGVLLFVTVKLYQLLMDYTEKFIPFTLYAIFQIFAMFFIHYFVPETKGKTLEEIQQELKGEGGKKNNKC